MRSAHRNSLEAKMRYPIPRLRLLLVHENIPNPRRVTIKRPHDAAKLLVPLKYSPDEQFVSIHLNAKNEVLGVHEVSHGTVSSSLVHPREVYKAALLSNSYAILVCHNHPSGSVIVPSKEDIDTTKQLIASGKLLGVDLIDHLIVGPGSRNTVYSMREYYGEMWKD